MIRVAVETSTSVGSVAVGRGDRVLAEVSLGVQSRHAEMTLPALDAALELAGVEREEIDAVVVGAGPGSFTGVRVAAATAKGLAAGLDVPLAAYPSLLALTLGVASDRPVCGLIDARRGEVYAGCWSLGDGPPRAVLGPLVASVAEVVDRTRELDPVFVGDGAQRYHDELVAAGAAVAGVVAYPRASALLWLAEHAGGAVSERASWEPDYVRASGAELGVRG